MAGRGAPPKQKAQENKRKRNEAKLVDEILKNETMLVDNYSNYWKVLHDAAMGTLEGCSVTNRISSAKLCASRAEEIMAEQEKSSSPEDVVAKDDAPKESARLIEIDFKQTQG